MLTLDVNGKNGVYKLNLPTSINEIDESYIAEVTDHIKVDANYTLIGVVFRERLSTLILAARKNKKNSDIGVIPVFVKAGKTDSDLINSLNIRPTHKQRLNICGLQFPLLCAYGYCNVLYDELAVHISDMSISKISRVVFFVHGFIILIIHEYARLCVYGRKVSLPKSRKLFIRDCTSGCCGWVRSDDDRLNCVQNHGVLKRFTLIKYCTTVQSSHYYR